MRTRFVKAAAYVFLLLWSSYLIASFFGIWTVPSLESHPEIKGLSALLIVIALLQIEILNALDKS